MDPKSQRLFNLLVVLGASMTAGSLSGACSSGGSGTIDPQAAKDAAADGKQGDADYAQIRADFGDAYAHISPAPLPEAGLDAYPHIGVDVGAGDAYPNIGPPPQGDI